jgi:transporter family-2 protein
VNYILSVLSGVLIAAMIVVNGGLTSQYGAWTATVIIHIVGFILISLILLFKREKMLLFKRLPFYLFTGGLIGVATTVFTNMAFGKISVSAILALCLLGQTITSLIIDRYGCFNMPKIPFHKMKLFGIVFVVLGILVMLSFFDISMFAAVIVSLLSGVTIVTARTVNARLAEETSVRISTFINYVTGLALSGAILAAVTSCGLEGGLALKFSLPSLWTYTGGMIGVAVVMIANMITTKVPSFYMTLLLFIGQVFTGLLLDAALTQTFSGRNLIGGVFVAIGLSVNIWIDKRSAAA